MLSIVDGLDEALWHTPVVPSGWTVAGIVEHLGGAERHWFQQVVLGSPDELSWDVGRPPYDPAAALTCDRAFGEIVAYYREQSERSDAVLAVIPCQPSRVAARRLADGQAAHGSLGGAPHDRGDRSALGPSRDCTRAMVAPASSESL